MEQNNVDFYNALLLFIRGEIKLPTQDMPAWQYNALSLVQNNDMAQFVNTEEYKLAEMIGVQDDLDWFHFF